MLKYLPSRNVNPTYPVVQGQSYIIHRCVVFVKYTYSRPDDRDLEKSRRTNQCRFSQACKTQTTFWPVANCCLLRSHFFWITGWYILKSHKLRRVTLCAQEPPAIHVIQNLFFLAVSFLLKLQTRFESHKSYLLQQELFGASPPPATGLKYIWFQNVFHKFLSKELTSDVWANFRDVSWCLKKKSSVHLIPSPLAPPSPSFGSFLAIARNMSFTFSCKVESVAMNRTPYELNGTQGLLRLWPTHHTHRCLSTGLHEKKAVLLCIGRCLVIFN